MADREIWCLGTGDGWPNGERNHSSFLYHLGGQSLLVDCGERVSGSLHRFEVDLDSFEGILLSHMHCDHIGGFFMLIQGLWLDRRTRPLPIWMPRCGIEPAKSLLRSACLFEELLPFDIAFRSLSEGASFKVGEIGVIAYPTSHLASLKERFGDRYAVSFEAFCFQLEYGGAVVGHSGDIGQIQDLEPLLQNPLDLLLCELAHVEPLALFARLKHASVGKIVFTHLGRDIRARFETVEAAAYSQLGRDKVVFARDGDRIPF